MVKFVKIFILCILFTHCGKNYSSFPEVRIHSPSDGLNFSINDEIKVDATLRHEKLRALRVEIIPKNGLTTYLRHEQKISGAEYSLSHVVLLDDQSMEPGQYELRVVAYTDDDHASKAISFHYSKQPLETSGLLVAIDNGSTYDVMIAPYQGSPLFLQNLPGSGIKATTIQKNRQAVLLPEDNGDGRVIDTKTGALLYTIDNQTMGDFPFFRGLNSTDNRFTLGNHLGFVQTREASGTLLHNFSLDPHYYASYIAEGYDLMLVNARNHSNTNHRWIMYNPRTGTNLGERVTSDRIVAGFTAGQNRWWLFYQNSQEERMGRWTPGGGVDVVQTSFNGEIRAVERLSEYRFLVLSAGGFFEVDVRQAGKIPRNEFGPGSYFAYNALANRIAVIDGQTVKEYDLQSSQMVNQLTIPMNAVFVGYTFIDPNVD